MSQPLNEPQRLRQTLNEIALDELLKNHENKINGIFQQSLRLNPLATFCQKTGKPTGMLSRDTLLRALELYGQERLGDILYAACGATVDPLWINTKPACLDRLIEIDPIGYAVYCLGMICHINEFSKTKKPVQRRAETQWQLARAWQALNFLPEHELHKLNTALVQALIYGEPFLAYFQRHLKMQKSTLTLEPDTMAMFALEYKLIPIINATFAKATNNYKAFTVWATKRTGPSQVRLTESAQRLVQHEERAAKAYRAIANRKELANALDDIFNDETAYKPGAEPWRKTSITQSSSGGGLMTRGLFDIRNSLDTIAPTTHEENSLADVDLFADDDNTVEIKRISREEVEQMAREKQIERAREQMTQRPNTGLMQRKAILAQHAATTATQPAAKPAEKPVSGLMARLAALKAKKES